MPVVRAQVQYPTLTGLAEDVQQNVFHLFSASATLTQIATAFMANYLDVVVAQGAWMSSQIFEDTFLVDFYDMADAEPRVPYQSSEFGSVSMSAGTSLPLEATMCVSFAGPVVSGANPARRRGRVYLPTPITSSIDTSTGKVVWDSAYINEVRTAFVSFAEGLDDASPSVQLVVYSPTADAEGATLTEATTIATRGWIDDEPDTQRRRGKRQGTKSAYTITID